MLNITKLMWNVIEIFR